MSSSTYGGFVSALGGGGGATFGGKTLGGYVFGGSDIDVSSRGFVTIVAEAINNNIKGAEIDVSESRSVKNIANDIIKALPDGGSIPATKGAVDATTAMIASIVNKAMNQNILDPKNPASLIIQRATQIIEGISSGMRAEFMGVASILDALFSDLLLSEVLGKGTIDTYKKRRSSQSKTDPELDQMIAVLEKLQKFRKDLELSLYSVVSKKMKDTVSKTGDLIGNIRMTLGDVKELTGDKPLDRIRMKEIAKHLGITLNAIGKGAMIQGDISEALKTIGVTIDEFNKLKSVAEFRELMKEKSKTPSKSLLSEKFDKAVAKVAKLVGISIPEPTVGAGEVFGGDDIDAKKTRFMEKFDSPKKRRSRVFDRIMTDADNMSNGIITEMKPWLSSKFNVPYTSELDVFLDRLTGFSKTVKAENLENISGFVTSTKAEDRSTEFFDKLTNFSTSIKRLQANPVYEVMNDGLSKMNTAVDTFKSSLEHYRKLVTGGAEEEIRVLAKSTSSLDFDRTIKQFKYFVQITKIKFSMANAAKMYAEFSEGYLDITSQEVGKKKSEIVAEDFTKVMNAITTAFDRLDPLNGATAKIKPAYPKIKKILKEFVDAKIKIYDVAEAVNQYLHVFTEETLTNAEDIAELNKILQSTTIISEWYGEGTGVLFRKMFDAFPKDDPLNGGDDEWMYEKRKPEEFKTDAYEGKYDEDRPWTHVFDDYKHAGMRAFTDLKALKNILSAFNFIGTKLGKEATGGFMSIGKIYSSLVKFLVIGSIEYTNPVSAEPEKYLMKIDAKMDANAHFKDEYKMFVKIMKAIVAKVFVVAGIYDLYKRPFGENKYTVPRAILGGDSDPTEIPEIIPGAVEIYFRIPLIAQFFTEITDSLEKNGEVIKILPSSTGKFHELINMFIVDEIKSPYTETAIQRLIKHINNDYKTYTGTESERPMMFIVDFMNEVNRRYGIANEDRFDEYKAAFKVERKGTEAAGSVSGVPYITSYSILPGEDDSEYEGSAPSDLYMTDTLDSAGMKKTEKSKIGERSVLFASLYTKVMNKFAGATKGDDIKLGGLIRDFQKEVSATESASTRYAIVTRLVNGSLAVSTRDKIRAYIFHELIHAPIVTLISMRTAYHAFAEAIKDKMIYTTENMVLYSNGAKKPHGREDVALDDARIPDSIELGGNVNDANGARIRDAGAIEPTKFVDVFPVLFEQLYGMKASGLFSIEIGETLSVDYKRYYQTIIDTIDQLRQYLSMVRGWYKSDDDIEKAFNDMLKRDSEIYGMLRHDFRKIFDDDKKKYSLYDSSKFIGNDAAVTAEAVKTVDVETYTLPHIIRVMTKVYAEFKEQKEDLTGPLHKLLLFGTQREVKTDAIGIEDRIIRKTAPTSFADKQLYKPSGFENNTMLFTFNRLLISLIREFTDQASGRLFKPLIDDFAFGAFNTQIVSGRVWVDGRPDMLVGAGTNLGDIITEPITDETLRIIESKDRSITGIVDDYRKKLIRDAFVGTIKQPLVFGTKIDDMVHPDKFIINQFMSRIIYILSKTNQNETETAVAIREFVRDTDKVNTFINNIFIHHYCTTKAIGAMPGAAVAYDAVITADNIRDMIIHYALKESADGESHSYNIAVDTESNELKEGINPLIFFLGNEIESDANKIKKNEANGGINTYAKALIVWNNYQVAAGAVDDATQRDLGTDKVAGNRKFWGLLIERIGGGGGDTPSLDDIARAKAVMYKTFVYSRDVINAFMEWIGTRVNLIRGTGIFEQTAARANALRIKAANLKSVVLWILAPMIIKHTDIGLWVADLIGNMVFDAIVPAAPDDIFKYNMQIQAGWPTVLDGNAVPDAAILDDRADPDTLIASLERMYQLYKLPEGVTPTMLRNITLGGPIAPTQFNAGIAPDAIIASSVADLLKVVLTERETKEPYPFKRLWTDISDVPLAIQDKMASQLPYFKEAFSMLYSRSEYYKRVISLTAKSLTKPLVIDQTYGRSGDVGAMGSKEYVGVCQSISQACQVLIKCINNTMEYVQTDIPYFEPSKDFITTYKNINGSLPLMPLSSMLHMPYEQDAIFQTQKYGEDKIFRGMQCIYAGSGTPSIDKFIGLRGDIARFNALGNPEVPLDDTDVYQYYSKISTLSRAMYAQKMYSAMSTVFNSNAMLLKTNNDRDNLKLYAFTGVSMLLDLTTNINPTDSIGSIAKPFLARGGGGAGVGDLVVNNMLDINVVPFNFWALMKDVPLTHIELYSLGFDSMAYDIMNKYTAVDVADLKTGGGKAHLMYPVIVPQSLTGDVIHTQKLNELGSVLYKGRFISDGLYGTAVGAKVEGDVYVHKAPPDNLDRAGTALSQSVHFIVALQKILQMRLEGELKKHAGIVITAKGLLDSSLVKARDEDTGAATITTEYTPFLDE